MMIPYCILVIEDDDDRAFMEQLYKEYHRLMYSEIFKLLSNQWDTEDVMQTVLEKLIDKIPDLRTKPRDNLVNYIISACKNTARNFLRDNSKAANDLVLDDYEAGRNTGYHDRSTELPLLRAEEVDSLKRIWPKLSERAQSLLEGYYILEKPTSVLAEEFGLAPHSVHTVLSRYRRKAFELLREEFGEEL